MKYKCSNGHENIAYQLPERCPNCGSSLLKVVSAGGAGVPLPPPKVSGGMPPTPAAPAVPSAPPAPVSPVQTARKKSGWPIIIGVVAALGLTVTALMLAWGLTRHRFSASQPAMNEPWTNSLGVRFVPVPGTKVLFSVWDVRVQDFAAFVKETGYDQTAKLPALITNQIQMFFRTNAISGIVGSAKEGEVFDPYQAQWFVGKPTGIFKASIESVEGCNWQSLELTHPVCGVSWGDAQAYCAWLTKRERKAGKISESQSYRLPSDAEWSVAVGLNESSGGTPKQKDEQIRDVYPWGTNWPPPSGAGNYAGIEAKEIKRPSCLGKFGPKFFNDRMIMIEGYNDGYVRTSPVGSFRPNQFGLYDMGGNVLQWCEDCYDDGKSDTRVVRGSSWNDATDRELLSSSRLALAPGSHKNNCGFRCVLVGESTP